MLKRNLTLDDIRIYDLDPKFGESGYNLGDLLNMPYYWAGWPQTPHLNEIYHGVAKNTAANNPNTILGKYYFSRPEKEKIPNLERLYNTIDNYISDNGFMENKIMTLVNSDNVLFVHVRSGDFGVIDKRYSETIKQLAKNYSTVILMSGVNRNHHPGDENSRHNFQCRKNLLDSFNMIMEGTDNICVYLAEPDHHISMMRLCKNLLVHRGGFSVIGTFICNGNIFYTDALSCKDNKEWKEIVKNKNIVKV